MKRLVHASIVSLVFGLGCGDDREAPITVVVDLNAAALATVGPDFMGVHTAVYDGRLTTSAATKQRLMDAGFTSLRYPGGSYADLYHWETHTGTQTPAAGFGGGGVYIDKTADFGKFIGLLGEIKANTMITVNYGMDSAGTGPGLPHEAAAWVAYANSLPGDTKVIGVDPTGFDWGTAGDWATLRASAPLAVDDGKNFLRISRTEPVGVKYWEIGNELYGNGYYHGREDFAGWEVDMRAPYNGIDGTLRKDNPALAPEVYGMGVKDFSIAMKAVDPTIHIGAIVHWPYTEYSKLVGETDWDESVLPHACDHMDFAANHWYGGTDTVNSLLTISAKDIPLMFTELRAEMARFCGPRGATMPIAITEWGPDLFEKEIGPAFNPQPATPGLVTPPATRTQIGGIFAAEAYANFMEQGAISIHWAQLHDRNFLHFGEGLIPPDAPMWGYHGAEIAHHLAGVGDMLIPAKSDSANLLTHAARRTDGGASIMLSNITPRPATKLTVKLAGASGLATTGTRYAYTPMQVDLDGTVVSEPISMEADGASVAVVVPGYSVVVLVFPKR